jgi:uncharacterized protein YcbK (DUF882 family)
VEPRVSAWRARISSPLSVGDARPRRSIPLALLFVCTAAWGEPPARPSAAKAKPVGRYATAVEGWHAPVEAAIPVDDGGRPVLVLAALNTGERLELHAATDHGGFSARDLDRAALLLRDTRSGNLHPIEPRLLDLVYDLQNHFQSRQIRVISGYRTPRGRSSSNHGKGRAIDLVVPGSSDADVAEYARTLGFVGVGIYPTSGFVHVDVRERSYFWSDSSGPGRRNRERGILGDLAQSSDRAAMARGVARPSSFSMLLDVDAALRARGATSTEVVEEEDLETEESP